MSMLSRVAERIYWLGRYLERIENTARLVSVYGNVLLDLPRPATLQWDTLIAITGSAPAFTERYTRADERNVVRFYLADDSNPSSIVSSADSARENARTVREMIPASIWEGINDLHIYLEENVDGALARRGRDAFLSRVIEYCQTLVGCMAGSMSRDAAYHFLRAGRYLERADMTSRIVDVGTANVFPWRQGQSQVQSQGQGQAQRQGARDDGAEESPYEAILWMSVLRSLEALQMYRRLVPERVLADEVVDFLLRDENFPRAVANCLMALQSCLRHLPRNELALRTVAATIKHVQEANIAGLLAQQGMFDYIDRMQIEFNELHAAIRSTWFETAV
jgi:uncharacterized alpha-E superfamily protein